MKIYSSIRIEGGLFGPDLIDALTTADLTGQRPQDFGLPPRRNITDEVASAFNDARTLWSVFQSRLARLPESDLATSLTRDSWAIPFLGLLGYELRYNPRAYDVDGLTFAISHRAGETETASPVHVVGARQEMGRLAPSGRPRLSPHALMQEYLNRSEALWGVVTNGRTLRLLRDSTFVRRQAYVEFDLEAIFAEDRFADFVILYRLLHRTRLPQAGGEAQACLLEQYYNQSVEQGGRVREHLSEGVKACLIDLANGFLRHPQSEDLRAWVRSENDPLAIYRDLLRLVYRLLFLLVSEERGLISADPLYLEHYSISRLRRLVDERAAYTEDDDLWQSLRVLWLVQSDERFAALLGISPLNGELFSPLHVDGATLTNRNLLSAFWRLAYYQEDPAAPPRRVNYAALDTEELGSVYESLLEFHPEITWQSARPEFDLVTLGDERRSTGSHYTPPELVAPLILHTLEPVLAERLKGAATAREKETAILGMRVCDPACGSGHFLLAAARRLGKELARVRSGEDEPAPERVQEALRDVIAHCIFGVDKNPLAIELCRVALWLECHASGKPLTFLKHHICCGDSLMGVADLSVLKNGLPDETFKPVEGDDRALAAGLKRQNRTEREGQIGLFAWNPESELQHLAVANGEVDAIRDDTPELVRRKSQQYERRFADPAWLREKEACDLWTAAFSQPLQQGQPLITTATVRARLRDQAVSPRVMALAAVHEDKEHFFHWALEFPEIFEHGGFDVILGNPPFMGGLKISTAFGSQYRRWLEIVFNPFQGMADLCAAFFRRAFYLIKANGKFGMIATNTIGQGDSRESGLAILLGHGGNVTYAKRYVKWPGRATVEVNLISLSKQKVKGNIFLDDQEVSFISSRLDGEPESQPERLQRNDGLSFQGSIVLGMGFVLDSPEASFLISQNKKNQDCLFPYMNGEDVNSDPSQQPSRWVIQFDERDEIEAQEYTSLWAIVRDRVYPERILKDATKYPRMVNEWWKHWNNRQELYIKISPLNRVLVRSRVSELHMLAFVPKRILFSDATVIFAFEDNYHFALLQSSLHDVWLRKQASSLRTDIRYTPTDCFATFPFPVIEYETNNLPLLLQSPHFTEANQIGGDYYEYRRSVLHARQLGLTKTYNLFNNPDCTDEDISRLRELHAAMDNAILACYSWQDLDLDHGFHQTDRGQTRFTVAPEAKRTLLRRLLELNLQIAESERSERRPAAAQSAALRLAPRPARAAPSQPRRVREESPAFEAASSPQLAFDLPEPSVTQGAKTGPMDNSLYRCSLCRAFVVGVDRENHARERHKGQKVEFNKPG